MVHNITWLFVLGIVSSIYGYGSELTQTPLSEIAPLESLRSSVEGRLFRGVPFASACYDHPTDTVNPECSHIQSTYTSEVSRTSVFGAYIQSQWETCQATGQKCLLNYTNPRDGAPPESGECHQGSISEHFVDVRKPGDVSAAFLFSRTTNVPLVIKNTGHDYKGRSSAPNSLALWTHNLKTMSYHTSFVPDGCAKSQAKRAITVGAGIQWGEAYAFAEKNNVTIVGGSDLAVGVAGGWAQGGGHSALSNTMGLGVDRVLEYKIVTPDGVYRTANECQNEDLFWALRGGGGGTFGVVLESTILADPRVTIQAVILAWDKFDADNAKALFTIMTDNGMKWANEGWGGYGEAKTVIYVNPVLSKEDAKESMKPIVEFGNKLKAEGVQGLKLIVAEFPSWYGFFQTFSKSYVAIVGSSLALSSRLIAKSNFETTDSRSQLVDALLAAEETAPGLIILISPPVNYPYVPGTTSVTEAWRDSIYHVTMVSPWNWNASIDDIRGNYTRASEAADHLRRITPHASYSNEADVYEPDHETAFWGSNYPKLLSIKQKYDPDHLLDCWHCVGWNPDSPRFSCYL